MQAIRFSVAAKAPVTVVLDVAEPDGEGYAAERLEEFSVPRFKRKGWKEFRQTIDDGRIDEIVRGAGVTPEQAARTLLLYPLAPLTHRELQARIATPEGTGFVVEHCFRAAGVPEHVIKRTVDDGDADEADLERLAFVLAGIADPAEIAARLATTAHGGSEDGGGEGNGDADPLARNGNESTTSSTTAKT